MSDVEHNLERHPAAIDSYPPDDFSSDEDQLASALQEVCDALEIGRPIERSALLAKYPKIQEELVCCLDNLDFIREVAPQLADPNDATTSGTVHPLATLGDFRIVREIGRGGMGVVYEAEQLSLGRTVALKVLPFAAMLDEKQLKRFKNEARAAATLSHPHIVPVHSVGTERGVHFYAMQLIEGQSLAEVIRDLRKLAGKDGTDDSHDVSDAALRIASGTFGSVTEKNLEQHAELHPLSTPQHAAANQPSSIATSTTIRTPQAAIPTERSNSRLPYYRGVASLGIQAAEALSHAHESGLLHRDIKPANLMVDATGKLWVTDFGLARIEGDIGMTLTGDLLGTIRYMAPEQALAKRVVVDHRADIYSLGVTIYELLTLEPAVKGHDRHELLNKIAFDEPLAPRKSDRSIPSTLETIVLKAIEKNPVERYQSSREMAEDFRRYLDNKPIHARPVTRLERVWRWTARHRAVTALLALSTLLSTLVAIVALSGFASTRAALGRAERQRATAQQRLQMALQAVDDMYVNIATEWISEETSISAMQSVFLKRALQTYRELANELAEDGTQRKMLGETHEKVGQIHSYRKEFSQAAHALRGSIDVSEQLLTEEPNNSEHLVALVRRYGMLAESLQELVDHQQALQALDSVEIHLQALTKRHPRDGRHQRLWGTYYLQRAKLLLSMDQLGQAEPIATKAKDIFKKIYPASYLENPEPSDLEACLLLLKSRDCLAEIRQHQGHTDEARRRYEAALQFCNRVRRQQFPDSRRISSLAARLETQLAEITATEGRLVEAEKQLRQSLETQRQSFKTGYDPVLFFVKAFSKVSLNNQFEKDVFCDYAETQLRLAAVLMAQGRPFATEQVLGECIRTTQMLCDTRHDVLRYRVSRANSWALTGQLLARRRPDESRLAWQYSSAIWDDTLARIPHAAQYRSGIHDGSTDHQWHQENRPDLERFADAPSIVYEQFKHPLRETAIEQHAYGLAWYRGGNWRSAIRHFKQSAELRAKVHAFDWFYVAAAYQQLGEIEQARQWYDKAIEEVRQYELGDEDLCHLRGQVEELLNQASADISQSL